MTDGHTATAPGLFVETTEFEDELAFGLTELLEFIKALNFQTGNRRVMRPRATGEMPHARTRRSAPPMRGWMPARRM